MLVPDLRKIFGEEYRVVTEEGGRPNDPWSAMLLCRHGHFFPWGENTLAVSTDRRGAIAKRIAGLPCVTIVQDGEDGVNGVLRMEDFEMVYQIMKPRRRRRLSSTANQRLQDAGAERVFGSWTALKAILKAALSPRTDRKP